MNNILTFREAGKVLNPITFEPIVQLIFDVRLESLMDGPVLLGKEEFITQLTKEMSDHFRKYLEARL
jgi:hypothetical protein